MAVTIVNTCRAGRSSMMQTSTYILVKSWERQYNLPMVVCGMCKVLYNMFAYIKINGSNVERLQWASTYNEQFPLFLITRR